MAQNVYDQASRYLAKLDPPGFLRWLLEMATLTFHRWLDTRRLPFPGEPDRVCDTVAEMEDPDNPGVLWAAPLEFMLEPEADLFFRLLIYLGQIGLEERPSTIPGARYRIGAIVVNLTGVVQTSRSMSLGQTGMALSLGVVERNLSRNSAAEVIAGIACGTIAPVVLALIPLMQGGAEPGIIQEWIRLASAESDARRRGDYGGLALVFAEAAGRRDIWKTALAGWNMVQSLQVLEWMAEGEARGQVKALLRILQRRFGNVPTDLETTLRACTDLTQLDHWIDAAVAADTLDAFRHSIDPGTNGTA